jgi:hypothetical protein
LRPEKCTLRLWNCEKFSERSSKILDFRIIILFPFTWSYGSFGGDFFSMLDDGRLWGILQIFCLKLVFSNCYIHLLQTELGCVPSDTRWRKSGNLRSATWGSQIERRGTVSQQATRQVPFSMCTSFGSSTHFWSSVKLRASESTAWLNYSVQDFQV